MTIKNRQNPYVLLAGDIVSFLISLWLALVIRYAALPTLDVWDVHVLPFTIVFALSIIVFLIAGLYDKHTSKLQSNLPSTIFYAQVANALIAVSLFYFIPSFGINPKTILFLYLIISTAIIFGWRLYGGRFFILGSKDSIILIGNRKETEEISEELKKNNRYGTRVERIVDIDTTSEEEIKNLFKEAARKDNISAIVADSDHPKMAAALSRHYDFVLSQVTFFDIHGVYEQLFDRVPIDSINYSWLIDRNNSHALSDILKRIMDIIVCLPLAVVTLVLLPFVALIISLQDSGPVFITQERVGMRGKVIYMYKFRTMMKNDKGVWLGDSDNKVTPFGYFLRKSRIDELPQIINVIRGDISLIGPRPDIIGLGEKLVNEIPYYMTRYMVLPGLSGWAQIQQKPPQSTEETKMRFSYDLYYVKNRSFFLDLKIGLRTIKTLLSRTGM